MTIICLKMFMTSFVAMFTGLIGMDSTQKEMTMSDYFFLPLAILGILGCLASFLGWIWSL